MIGRYVNELYNFVKSVDIVNTKIWDTVMNGSFTKFLEANKIVRSAGYLAPASKQNKIVLEDIWYAKGEGLYGDGFSEDLENFKEKGHTLYAFARKKKIWVVDKNKKPLHFDDCEYVDLLENATSGEIPRFLLWPKGDKNYVKTSICIPDNLGARGVFNLELKPYVEPEAAFKEAIEKMAESIHLFYSMLRNRETSSENTIQSAKDLEKYAIVLPHTYFVSYASDEEEDAKEADHIEAFFFRHGRKVKRDVNSIHAGELIQDKIMEMINESDTFIALWSKDYNKSDWCKKELNYAIKKMKNNYRPFRVIFLRKDDTVIPELDYGSYLHLDGSERKIREVNLNEIMRQEEYIKPFMANE